MPSSRSLFPIASLASLALLVAVPACSDASSASSEDVGTATAAIAQVPANVACISISVAGARTVERKFDVTAGQSSVLALAQLPIGNVTAVGRAFPSACAQVTASSQPTWLSESTPATIVGGITAEIPLALRRNTSSNANVTVDFVDDDADAGAPADTGAPTGSFTVSPAILDFGPTSCGAAAPTRGVTVTNTGASAMTASAALLPGSTFVVSPATLTVPPGGSGLFQVVPGLVPQNARIPTTISATLRISAGSLGDRDIAITQTAQGAQLAFNPPSLGGSGSASVQLLNTGNSPARVTLTPQGQNIDVTPRTAIVAPGSSLNVQVSRPPLLSFTGSISVTTVDPICGQFPVLPIN